MTSTYKTTGVVVADSLGISESFQERVGLQDDVFHVLRKQKKKALGGTRVTSEANFRKRSGLDSFPLPELSILLRIL